MKHDETRSLVAGARRSGLHQDRLLDAAIVEPPVKPQCAKARVAQLAGLAGVLDDRDDARTQPAHAGAKRQRSGERRDIGDEVARRLVEPPAEIRRYVCLPDERKHVACEHPAQRADRAAPLILDEPAEHYVGARRDVAFEPVPAARAGDVRAVTAFRDDALEAVLDRKSTRLNS